MEQDPSVPADKKVSFAVVGLEGIAQAAVLPAFAGAADRAELLALVSSDGEKREELARQYGVRRTYPYEKYEDCLLDPDVDAVYLTLPTSMRADFAVRAARAGVHVLCEKPLAVTEREGVRMIREAERSKVKLMAACRLRFSRAHWEAVREVRSGAIGQPRIFDSVFAEEVREPTLRPDPQPGGGPLYDLGIHCLSAARTLFGSEPTEVFAFTAKGDRPRVGGVDEMLCGLLRFPGERLATFVCSFGAYAVSSCRVIGTRGELRIEPAFESGRRLTLRLEADGIPEEQEFARTDPVAAEIAYFADCVRTGQDPEPSGREGLADVRVLQALERSARTGRRVRLAAFEAPERPSIEPAEEPPASPGPPLFHARTPAGK